MPIHLRDFHTAKPLATGVECGVRNSVLVAEFLGRNPDFSFREDSDDLFAGKALLHGGPHVAYEDITYIKGY